MLGFLLLACTAPPQGVLSAGGWVVCVAAGPDSVCKAVPGEARDGARAPHDGQETLPAGDWAQLAPGFRHTCGLARDGTLSCWGDDSFGQTDPPTATFTSVSSGTHLSCALDAAGQATCWGAGFTWHDNEALPRDPTEAFTRAVAMESGACGLADGRLKCWGRLRKSRAAPDAGGFVDVRAQGPTTCGLAANGDVRCWGTPSEQAQDGSRFAVPMRAIAVSQHDVCGLTEAGVLVCDGFRDEGPWEQVAAGLAFVCVSRPGPEVKCFDLSILPQGADVTPSGW